MRKPTLSLLLLAVAAVPLGGCSLFGKSNNFTAQKSSSRQFKTEDFAVARLAAGREALDRGHWAEAITAFRDARHLPRLAAQAYNGTGVAYAELGRADLAERYFLLAVAEAPEDRRFAANLSRLYAKHANPEPVLAAAPEPIPALTPQRSALTTSNPAIRVERPAGRLVRTARGEMRLQSAPEGKDETLMASAAPAPDAPSPAVTFTRRSASPQ
jgi:tetratricopeptide (TPR) repeat protein